MLLLFYVMCTWMWTQFAAFTCTEICLGGFFFLLNIKSFDGFSSLNANPIVSQMVIVRLTIECIKKTEARFSLSNIVWFSDLPIQNSTIFSLIFV